MAAKLQKSLNLFTTGEPSTAQIDALKSDAYNAGNSKWKWGAAGGTKDDHWQHPLGGKYIMKVASGDMVIELLTPRKFSLTINAPKQYVRAHRFVYKLDAIHGTDGYLFTVITQPFDSLVEQYGAAPNLKFVGRFPASITDPGNTLWIRRGAGEWRD